MWWAGPIARPGTGSEGSSALTLCLRRSDSDESLIIFGNQAVKTPSPARPAFLRNTLRLSVPFLSINSLSVGKKPYPSDLGRPAAPSPFTRLLCTVTQYSSVTVTYPRVVQQAATRSNTSWCDCLAPIPFGQSLYLPALLLLSLTSPLTAKQLPNPGKSAKIPPRSRHYLPPQCSPLGLPRELLIVAPPQPLPGLLLP